MIDKHLRPSRIRRLPGLPWLVLLSVAVIAPITWRVRERSRVEEVASPPPAWLPVLVFTQDNVDLIGYGEIGKFEEAHPGYSFLAPEEQDELLNKELVASYRTNFPHGKGTPEFEVKELSPGRQALKLGVYGDGDLVVWYEATAHEAFPQRFLLTGPLFALMTLFWSVIVTAVLWGVICGSWAIIRKAGRSTS